jgi:hypothetical protein
MAIGVGLDVHRAQITYDALNTATEEVATGRIAPGDRATLRIFLRRWAGEDVEAAVEATTDRRPELRMRPVGGGQLVGHALAPGDARPGPAFADAESASGTRMRTKARRRRRPPERPGLAAGHLVTRSRSGELRSARPPASAREARAMAAPEPPCRRRPVARAVTRHHPERVATGAQILGPDPREEPPAGGPARPGCRRGRR